MKLINESKLLTCYVSVTYSLFLFKKIKLGQTYTKQNKNSKIAAYCN